MSVILSVSEESPSMKGILRNHRFLRMTEIISLHLWLGGRFLPISLFAFCVILSVSEESPSMKGILRLPLVAQDDRKWDKKWRCVMYFVYMLTNTHNTTLYIGVTGNLGKRLYEHKNQLVSGFSKTYNLHKLVYFESTTDVRSAIAREKQLKGWTRAKKNALIERMNPQWKDLGENLF